MINALALLISVPLAFAEIPAVSAPVAEFGPQAALAFERQWRGPAVNPSSRATSFNPGRPREREYYPDARPAPVEGDWRAVGGRVEASLAGRGIEDPEYWQWKTAMLARYEVDMTPFLELVGQVAR